MDTDRKKWIIARENRESYMCNTHRHNHINFQPVRSFSAQTCIYFFVRNELRFWANWAWLADDICVCNQSGYETACLPSLIPPTTTLNKGERFSGDVWHNLFVISRIFVQASSVFPRMTYYTEKYALDWDDPSDGERRNEMRKQGSSWKCYCLNAFE